MKSIFNIDINLYDEIKLLEAIKDFSDVWKIKLENSVLSIYWDSKNEIQEIFNELMNYVISLEYLK